MPVPSSMVAWTCADFAERYAERASSASFFASGTGALVSTLAAEGPDTFEDGLVTVTASPDPHATTAGLSAMVSAQMLMRVTGRIVPG
ncbi:hypothetical protein GCM10011492_21450 [Flexivirga endophytica]|uniref:Uncharacterized protein n=1 Tax=Flexivirga endophytica TaxID=1849103 RepID=A0A916WUD9_9MICO|nr:hypothetical protein GCM10011492_21450 [Flexivirga endophytica]GHB51584.1 hypothetical protein GCM10008112_20720 [Flexivirga endophytica]